MKKFLKVGFVCLFSSFLCKSVVANNLSLEDLLIQKEIKSSISKEELNFLMKYYTESNNKKIIKIKKEINNIVFDVYGDESLKKTKKDFDLLIKNENFFKNIKLDYEYAIPKFIFKNVGFENDSSESKNLYDLKNNCSVVLKFDVDNLGRVFESSELGYKTKEQITKSSDFEIENTLKETLFHEMSHCLLKEKNFSPIVSDDFNYKYNNLSKSLLDKISKIRNDIKNYGFNSLNVFDYIIFSIYNETYADVMSAFVRVKEEKDIVNAKKQLINLLEFRINGRSTHKDYYGVLNALSVLDSNFDFNEEKKELLAREISTISILQNIKEVFYEFTKIDDDRYISLYLSNSIKIEDKKIKIKLSEKYNDINEDVANLKSIGFSFGNRDLIVNLLKEIKDKKINIYDNFDLVNEKILTFLNGDYNSFVYLKNFNRKDVFFENKELKKKYF